MESEFEILIAGGGPAGLSLATSLGTRGHRVLVVDPAIEQAWDRSYGTFSRPWVEQTLSDAVAHRAERCRITFASGRSRCLSQGYLRFDTPRLQRLLRERALSVGAELRPGHVRRRPEGLLLEDENGVERRTPPLVVDCTGKGLSSQAIPRGYQTAYGAWLRVDRAPFQQEEMCLMDYRSVRDGQALPPTFLYALMEADGLLFAQETVLCAAQPVSQDALQARLLTRLPRLGIGHFRIEREERCLIPLGGGTPRSSGSVMPYGAAAGMVQPASGYQISRAIGLADEVAEAISSALTEGAGAQEAAARGMTALWTQDRRRAFSLYEFGLESLLKFNPSKWEEFASAFFDLPEPLIVGFMEGTLRSPEVASCMWNVFVTAPMGLRMELLVRGSKSLGLLKQSVS